MHINECGSGGQTNGNISFMPVLPLGSEMLITKVKLRECGLIWITAVYSSMILNIDRRGRGVCEVPGVNICVRCSVGISVYFFLTLK